MRALAAMLVLAAALALSACSQPSQLPVAEAAEAPAPAPAAEKATEFRVSGPIVVENQIDLLAPREGILVELRAEPGQRAKRGELLARLDDRQIAAERDAAVAKMNSIRYDQKNWEARVKIDEVDLERAQKMWDAGLITQEQFDHQRFRLVASRNELEREKQDEAQAAATIRVLELELEKTRIIAPFDGVVARRYARLGQKLSKDERVLWLTATAPLEVRFTLPQRFMGKVREGDRLTMTTESSAENFAATVRAVSPVIDPSSGTIEVVARIGSAPAELRPGMTATAVIPE